MSSFFSLLMSHFWLLCGIWVGGFGAWTCYSSLARHVKSGQLAAAERSQFVKGWFGTIFGSTFVLWVLQLSAGPAPTPFYVDWPFPQREIAAAFNVFVWLLLLWWAFAKGGAEYLSRLAAFSNSPFRTIFARPITFRLLAIAIFISGISALAQHNWNS